MKNKTMKSHQKGGILVNEDLKKVDRGYIFGDFIDRCDKIQLLNDSGSFGVIFKASMDNSLDSPYLSFQPNNFKQPVHTLLVKVVALSNKKLDEYNDYWPYVNGHAKHIDLQENFEKEVNIQTDIYFKTMHYLEPICPAPVFSKIFDTPESMLMLIEIFEERTKHQYTKDVLQAIRKNIEKKKIPSIGILAMEVANDFIPMIKLYQNCLQKNDPGYLEYYLWCEQMAKLQILKLAMETGYSHNDHHLGNILINPNYKDHYSQTDGKVFIIDFGFTTKLSSDKLKEIRSYYKNGEYSNALKVFETLERSDGLKIEEYPTFYGWLYNLKESFSGPRAKLVPKSDAKYDEMIGKLIKREDSAIDERIEVFRYLHHNNSNKYPHLPMGNSIKNYFYQGFITPTGKKNETKQYKD